MTMAKHRVCLLVACLGPWLAGCSQTFDLPAPRVPLPAPVVEEQATGAQSVVRAMEKMRDIFASTAAAMPFIQEIKKTKIDGVDALELTMDMSEMFKNMPNNPAATKMMNTPVQRKKLARLSRREPW